MKTQIVRSSTEVEYQTIATTTQEIEPVKSLLGELGIIVPKLLGVTFIAKNPIRHIKHKHIAIDLNIICQCIENGTLHIPMLLEKINGPLFLPRHCNQRLLVI